MSENQEPSKFTRVLASHLKDAFLHTKIPVQANSLIPDDDTFLDMARHLRNNDAISVVINCL